MNRLIAEKVLSIEHWDIKTLASAKEDTKANEQPKKMVLFLFFIIVYPSQLFVRH